MARIDRKIKREQARARKARTKREQELINRAYDAGVGMGIQFQKQKVEYATLGMGYLYEYKVSDLVGDSGDANSLAGSIGSTDTSLPVAGPAFDVVVTELEGGVDFVQQVPA
jgi:hypothetical protein